MRWETTIWMSAVLVVATSALNLPIEHQLHPDHTSYPALNTEQDIVHVVSGPEDIVINAPTTGDKIENESVRIFMETDSISGKAENDNDNLIKPGSDSKSVESDNSSSKTSETSQEDSQNRHRSGNADAEESNPIENPPKPDPEHVPGPGEVQEVTTTTVSEPTTVGEGSDPTMTPEESETTNGEEITQSDTEETTSDGEDSPPASGGDDEVENTPEPQLPDTDVLTSTGRVRGHVWQGDKRILSYIDIKYGTFSNHFEAPKSPDIDEDAPIHNEKDHKKHCPQLGSDDTLHGEPDCLTLSIFKPSKELTKASVLVHIHEGNFISESADPAIYGPDYLVVEDIILVLPNYRLGPLGFLCLQNETAPGNAALKDLALALKWIKENIDKFGGDPENIAVSGEGTAGALAGYLALSPMSKNNVNKVITESGSVLSHWAIDRNPIVAATNLVQGITGHWEWQTLDIKALLIAGKDIAWRPCLENNTENGTHFMVETPWSMLQKADINVTWMIGSAKYAGVHESLNHTQASVDQLNADARLLLPSDLRFQSSQDESRVGDQVKKQYFGETITLDNLRNRTLYYTDMAYLGPGLRTARSLASSGSKVYFYEFSFVGDFNWELEAVQKQVDGAVRGDIIGYLFHQEGKAPAEGSKEGKMIIQLVEFWTSFLRDGKPSYSEDIQWTEFEKAAASEEQWLSINGTETALMTGVHVDRVGLWTEIYQEHFIDRSPADGISPSVYTVLLLQLVFFITFFRNAWHFF